MFQIKQNFLKRVKALPIPFSTHTDTHIESALIFMILTDHLSLLLTLFRPISSKQIRGKLYPILSHSCKLQHCQYTYTCYLVPHEKNAKGCQKVRRS